MVQVLVMAEQVKVQPLVPAVLAKEQAEIQELVLRASLVMVQELVPVVLRSLLPVSVTTRLLG
jgi:hypothetical protein